MVACSSSVGSTPALARSWPSTHVRSGFTGTYGKRLTALGVRSSASRNPANVSQLHGKPARIDSSGIASTRVSVRIACSRSAARTGAKPKPQFPIATDVTPCQPDNEQYGSQNTCAS